MGLEIVEVIMCAEEEFEIAIPDADAEQATTCGALCDLVVENLRERGDTPDENEVWEKVRAIIVDQVSVPPEMVTREARFVQELDLG